MTINYKEFYSFRSASADPVQGADDIVIASLVEACPSGRGPYRQFFKRAFDIVAIVLAAPVVMPIVAIAAVMVARDGGSPFYTQMRVGKGGKRFRMWKLRSMVRDADARMEEFLAANPEARMEWDSTQKLKADPRITRMGKFLRKSSLDELPQLWNVLMGDMSLVGPRPMMISQQSLYPGRAYYALRPGITGYWQTSGRNRTTFEARAGFDDAYEADLSMLTDVKVLAATVGVVVHGTGY
ncbi:MAG: sugar transferase [Cypionkella sp.]|uniref:sugar transferase n=1 Tax=Cypionkella sp. TaxID=2811411 RepID=UPI002AB8E678|nr:sugar transferase [Cypionkella sp.]MDZ4310142.1 sugar transferase [Cypionkella sp.]MDZ4392358.1 sugar transferase [Cypionkella sp.]